MRTPFARKEDLADIERLLHDARPGEVRLREAHFQSTLDNLMSRFDELAPAPDVGVEAVESVLEAARPSGAVFDEVRFRETRQGLLTGFDAVSARAGHLESGAAARPVRTRNGRALRVLLAVAAAAFIAVSLFFWLKGPAPSVRKVARPPFKMMQIALPDPDAFTRPIVAAVKARAEAARAAAEASAGQPAEKTQSDEESPAPEDVQPPTEQPAALGIQLAYYTLTADGISLSWSFTSGGAPGAAFDGSVVLRAEAGLTPAWPGDRVSELLSTDSFVDSSVTGGNSYAYRVVLLKGGAPVACSGVITVYAQACVEVTLSGGQQGTARVLDWSVDMSGLDPGITHFILSRSTSASEWSGDSVRLPASVRSFGDSGQPELTWYYRITACSGDRVIATGNTVAIPATAPPPQP